MNQSNDYKKFNMLDYNRELNRNQINKIKASITRNGYLTSNPIIVDKYMNIIDGQHRFVACKDMGLPIFYEIIEGGTDLIIDLNTTQKKWNMGDYINYYARKGNANYQRIQTLKKKTGVSYDLILTLTTDKGTSGTITERVRRGSLMFTIDDTLRAQSMLGLIKDICNNLRLSLTSRFAASMLEISKLKNFKWDRMMKQSKDYSTVAYRCQNKEEYIKMLKDLYNFQSRSVATRI